MLAPYAKILVLSLVVTYDFVRSSQVHFEYEAIHCLELIEKFNYFKNRGGRILIHCFGINSSRKNRLIKSNHNMIVY